MSWEEVCRDPPELSMAAETAVGGWRSALAWQHAVDRALADLGMTHTQFLVLLGAALATANEGNAVTQQEIADAAGLDKVTTSRIARKLAEEGLVDRGLHGVDDRKLRIYVTREGRMCLERACARLDAVAAALA